MESSGYGRRSRPVPRSKGVRGKVPETNGLIVPIPLVDSHSDMCWTVTVNAPGGAATTSFFVQVPKYFKVISVLPVFPDCPFWYTGYEASVLYVVADQSNVEIRAAGLTPQEHVTVNGTHAFSGFRPFATPATTDADGFFTDVPVGTCITPPPPPNRCVNVVQTFNVQVPSTGGTVTYPIDTVTTRRDCQEGIRVQVTPGSTETLGTVN